MKKIFVSLILVLGLFIIPNSALAASCSSTITGNKTVNEGATTTLYVKLNSSNLIRGVDIAFDVSGNLKLVSASPVGLTEMAKEGNRFILYSNNGVKSGSNIFAIKVKGTTKGTGKVTIKSIEATIGEDDTTCSLTSANITIKEVVKKENTVTPKTEDKKNTSKEEVKSDVPKEEEKEATKDDVNYEKAVKLVTIAEKNKTAADIDTAKAVVDNLPLSEKKVELINRLFNINVENDNKAETPKIQNDMKDLTTDVTGGMSWFFLAVILLICLTTETVYMLVKEVKKNGA